MKKKSTPKPPLKPLAARITESLEAAVQAAEQGKKPSEVFRVDVLDIPDPPRFTAARVKQLRGRLRVTQGIFARLVGVSVELVEHWEQGIRVPQPLACRLLNEIDRDPSGFLERLPRSERAA
jgi:DNA-binding transcriptional regulator YiaG